MKVRIKSLPKSENGSQVNNKFQGKEINWPGFSDSSSDGPKLKNTLAPVSRAKANVEAEKGEVAIADMNFDGIPEHFVVGGQRHHSGGTPLNLPPDSFIFSDTQKMKIKDKEILARFGLSKGSYTPAEIAKKYNINKYRAVLYDKDADKIQHESAEKMIQNYNQKLGELALIQESKKGFPQGIPTIAMPYLETHGIDPQQFLPQSPVGGQPSMQGEDMTIEDGMEQQPMMRFGGPLRKFQEAGQPDHAPDGVTGAGNFMKYHFFNDPPMDFKKNISDPYLNPALQKFRSFLEKANTYQLPRIVNEPEVQEQSPQQIPGFGNDKFYNPETWGDDNPERAAKFRSKYPSIMEVYEAAMGEIDPETNKPWTLARLEEASKEIEKGRKLTPFYSLDMFASSDADKMSDLAGIVREKVDKLKQVEKQAEYKKTAQAKIDKFNNYRKGLVDKMAGMVKELNGLPKGSFKKIELEYQIKALEKELNKKQLPMPFGQFNSPYDIPEEVAVSPGLVTETAKTDSVVAETAPADSFKVDFSTMSDEELLKLSTMSDQELENHFNK